MISVAGIFTIRQEKKHETTPFKLGNMYDNFLFFQGPHGFICPAEAYSCWQDYVF